MPQQIVEETKQLWDTVVVGGGPAGSALAMLLARAGLRVALADAGARELRPDDEPLCPSAEPLLKSLGVWRQFLEDGHLPYFGVRQVWGDPTPRERDVMGESGVCGWRLDRARFRRALHESARREGARLWTGVKATDAYKPGGAPWSLELVGPGGAFETRARFLVDATGRERWLTRKLGVDSQRDDRLTAAVAAIGGVEADDEGRMMWIEAAPSGWWRLSPLPGDGHVLCLFSDEDLLQETGSVNMPALLAQTVRLGPMLRRAGRLTIGEPRLVVAGSERPAKTAGGGWLAVGEAAAAYDPLSAQGAAAALVSAFHAKDAITTRFRGNGRAMESYQQLIDMTYRDALAQRDVWYADEGRWPDAPFWRRRLGDRAAAESTALAVW